MPYADKERQRQFVVEWNRANAARYKERRDVLRDLNREKERKRYRLYRAANLDAIRERQRNRLRRSRAQNPDKHAVAETVRRCKEYGITPDILVDMNVKCGGRCQVCGDPPSGRTKRLHIDHDHQTGRVRGLLCGPCNLAIGKLKDSPELLRRAASYLEDARVDVSAVAAKMGGGGHRNAAGFETTEE